MKGKLSTWHIDRMRHLRDVRGLDLDAIGWLYGRRSAEEVQAILEAPAAPVQKKTRCSRAVRYIPRAKRILNTRPKRVPAELVAEMHALHLGGMNLTAIGERFNRSNASIRDLFLARGLPMVKQPRRKSTKPRKPSTRKKSTRFTEELVAEIYALYVSGISCANLGSRYHCHQTTIGDLFKARNLEYPIKRSYPQRRRARIASDVIATMHAYYTEGYSLADVGRKFGRSGKQVGHLFRDRGLTLRQVGRPPSNGRRVDGTFETYTPATEEAIATAIAAATKVLVPDRLRLDWRKWSLERRGDFIRRIREKLQSPRDRPSSRFSDNVTPFDYTTPAARAIAAAEAKQQGKTSRRICPSKIKLTSQGVIWNGKLWFWSSANCYTHGIWPDRSQLHRVIWEHHHGRKLSFQDVIRFTDGNPNNLDPSNLALSDRAEMARESTLRRRTRESREKLSAALNRHQNPAKDHDLIGQLLRA